MISTTSRCISPTTRVELPLRSDLFIYAEPDDLLRIGRNSRLYTGPVTSYVFLRAARLSPSLYFSLRRTVSQLRSIEDQARSFDKPDHGLQEALVPEAARETAVLVQAASAAAPCTDQLSPLSRRGVQYSNVLFIASYILVMSGTLNFSKIRPGCIDQPVTRATGASSRKKAPS